MSLLSCNVPLPGGVRAAAEDLVPYLTPLDQVREEHTFVCKRLGRDERPRHVRERLRTALAGAAPFRVRLDGVGVFETPASGPGPVVYLGVESPGLVALHERLCETFAPVDGLEGDAYVPHVTLGRGGTPSPEELDRLREQSPPPVEWTVDRLYVYDASYEQVAAELSLPP